MNNHQKIVDAYFAEIGETYWPVNKILEKIKEETIETKTELDEGNPVNLELENGDLLFAICCLGNNLGINFMYDENINVRSDNNYQTSLKFLIEIELIIDSILNKMPVDNSEIIYKACKIYSLCIRFSKDNFINDEHALVLSIAKFRKRWESFKNSTEPGAQLSDFK